MSTGKGCIRPPSPRCTSWITGALSWIPPGIREFGLVHFGKEEIPRCFPEMDRLLDKCQFKNCTHVHEPGCAVLAAIETGEVSVLRYNSYLSILNDE